MNTKEYNRLSAIVDNFMIENDLSSGWYAKCLAWAYRGLREISIDSIQTIKTALLDVTDRKTATLPKNFLTWTKIAVKRGQYAVMLGVNDDLTSLRRTVDSDTVSGLLSQHMPNGIDFGNYSGYNFYGFNGGSMFAIGGGLPSKGYFKVHDNGTCMELLLDYDYPYDQIYVEYITDGIEDCADPYVSPILYDYLTKYMEHEYERKNNPKASQASIERSSQEVFWASKRVRARQNNIDFQTLLNITRAETRLTPKM
jgi:hypothetical protein